MSRKRLKKLIIDNRRADVIEEKIDRLAESYDTGWHMNTENPDIGTALAHVFAGQMEENIDRVNEILDRYHTEFVNMLDISLLPARPSQAIVVLNLLGDTVDGTGVTKGTKFMTETDDPQIFEADHSIYVTSSELVSSFMTDLEEGTVSDLMTDEGIRSFKLFGRTYDYPENKAAFYHPFLFNAVGDELYVRIKDNGGLISAIEDGKFVFRYLTEHGVKEINDVKLLDDKETFMLCMKESGVIERVEERNFYYLSLEANGPVQMTYSVDALTFSAAGKGEPPESVTNGTNDLVVSRFEPFTDTIDLYAECYIGADRFFAKAGATVTITFNLKFEENRISLEPEEQDESLKIIKRRSAVVRNEAYTDCYIDQIAIEYFNGVGWRRLETLGGGEHLFDSRQTGTITMTFVCPDDWVGTSVGAYDGRSIRIQVTKADNFYLRPAVHHYPVIRDMSISYTYEDNYILPSKLLLTMGKKHLDATGEMYKNRSFVLFTVSEYIQDALYLGFSKRIESGPASILFELEEGVRYNGLDVNFEYSCGEDFRQMKVLDYTDGFTRTGIVAFVPPSDWSLKELETESRYWIRIVRTKKEEKNEVEATLPMIRRVAINAIHVSNMETRPEETVYIEEVVPNMRFTLGATGVLDADVWVNEMGHFTQDKMTEMHEDDPDNIRIERDPNGAVTAFYVRWKETDRFETATDKRVYQLDRLTNELIFGDGVHTWMPSVLDDAAVRFTVRCCNGGVGNVPANSITTTKDFINFVGDVTNPVKAYGGSNIESLDNALERGASILSSRYRLISMDDYIRSIMAYSDNIDACVGVTGETVDGDYDVASMTFVLLMKEFEEGSYAFHRVVGGLRRYLLDQCELTVLPSKLHIIEPVYVSISVSVWLNVVALDDSFEIQNLLEECLDEYLSPLGYNEGSGWRIGTLPKKPQILMRLGILKSRAIVRKSVMIASYTDNEGRHEVDLETLKVTPFMVCRSGEHKVHILY